MIFPRRVAFITIIGTLFISSYLGALYINYLAIQAGKDYVNTDGLLFFMFGALVFPIVSFGSQMLYYTNQSAVTFRNRAWLFPALSVLIALVILTIIGIAKGSFAVVFNNAGDFALIGVIVGVVLFSLDAGLKWLWVKAGFRMKKPQ